MEAGAKRRSGEFHLLVERESFNFYLLRRKVSSFKIEGEGFKFHLLVEGESLDFHLLMRKVSSFKFEEESSKFLL